MKSEQPKSPIEALKNLSKKEFHKTSIDDDPELLRVWNMGFLLGYSKGKENQEVINQLLK